MITGIGVCRCGSWLVGGVGGIAEPDALHHARTAGIGVDGEQRHAHDATKREGFGAADAQRSEVIAGDGDRVRSGPMTRLEHDD